MNNWKEIRETVGLWFLYICIAISLAVLGISSYWLITGWAKLLLR
jgi:hypothetical protein